MLCWGRGCQTIHFIVHFNTQKYEKVYVHEGSALASMNDVESKIYFQIFKYFSLQYQVNHFLITPEYNHFLCTSMERFQMNRKRLVPISNPKRVYPKGPFK